MSFAEVKRSPRAVRRERPVDYPTGSNAWPQAQVYVLPCGHGVLICSSQSQSAFVHVKRVPATF